MVSRLNICSWDGCPKIGRQLCGGGGCTLNQCVLAPPVPSYVSSSLHYQCGVCKNFLQKRVARMDSRSAKFLFSIQQPVGSCPDPWEVELLVYSSTFRPTREQLSVPAPHELLTELGGPLSNLPEPGGDTGYQNPFIASGPFWDTKNLWERPRGKAGGHHSLQSFKCCCNSFLAAVGFDLGLANKFS